MSRRIGAHDVEVHGDILKLTVRGTFTLDDMTAFTAIADVQAAPLGYLLVLSDVNAAGGLSAEARRYSAAQVREAQKRGPVYAASASFGSNLIVRGMVTLYYSMLRLTSSGEHRNHIAKNENEALDFLGAQRSYFQAQLKKT